MDSLSRNVGAFLCHNVFNMKNYPIFEHMYNYQIFLSPSREHSRLSVSQFVTYVFTNFA